MFDNSRRAGEPGLLLGALMPPPAIGAGWQSTKAGDLLATRLGWGL